MNKSISILLSCLTAFAMAQTDVSAPAEVTTLPQEQVATNAVEATPVVEPTNVEEAATQEVAPEPVTTDEAILATDTVPVRPSQEDTTVAPVVEPQEPQQQVIEEQPQKEVPQEEPKKEKEQKPQKPGNPNVQKQLGLGVGFFNTGETSTTTMNYEFGIWIKQKTYVGISGYNRVGHNNSDTYVVGTVWGINGEFLRRLGTKFIRLDLGAKVGWNLYEEENYFTSQNYREVRLGGPQAILNLFFGPVQIFGGYTYMMGYRELEGDDSSRKYGDSHQISFGIGIAMKK